MVLTDWTITGIGTATIDATDKYSGNSSLKCTNGSTPYLKVEHNTFLAQSARIICWMKMSGPTYVTPRMGGTGYGAINLGGIGTTPWFQVRVTFWYDIGNDTKWARIEKNVGSNWVQQGTDLNLGTGDPGISKFFIGSAGSGNHSVWYDEVELWSS